MASIYQTKRRDGRLQLDDIDGFYSFLIGLQFTPGAPGATFDPSAQLVTAVAAAGRNGQALTNQASASIDDEGWVVGANSGNWAVDIVSTSQPPQDAGTEVFVEFTALNTLSFFKSDGAGGRAAVTLPAQPYVAYVPYRASIEKLPPDFAIRSAKHRISEDAPQSSQPTLEHLAIATLNTVPALTNAPRAGTYVTLHVDGREFHSSEPVPLFTLAGAAVTWDSAAAGMDIWPGARVSAEYIV